MEHTCPRRVLSISAEKPDTWREDGTCSYCGSMHPGEFIRRLGVGDIELGPTDKNYKVYVKNVGGEPAPMKFYFQHLSREQRQEFVDLFNLRSGSAGVKLGYPGYFYRLPFFMTLAEPLQ